LPRSATGWGSFRAMARRFANRLAAAKALLPRLQAVLTPEDAPVIIALPRGGVPIAAALAKALNAPLDLVLLRKIGLPKQPELAVAAITNGQHPALHVNAPIARAAGLSRADIERLAAPGLAEIARRRALWYDGTRPRPSLAGKTVVVVDDGIATGASLRAALAWLGQQRVGRLILAVPVAPPEVLAELEADADAIICLATPQPFHAVGAHYEDFPQVTDAEVTEALAASRA